VIIIVVKITVITAAAANLKEKINVNPAFFSFGHHSSSKLI
jgi:hypothetical protein